MVLRLLKGISTFLTKALRYKALYHLSSRGRKNPANADAQPLLPQQQSPRDSTDVIQILSESEITGTHHELGWIFVSGLRSLQKQPRSTLAMIPVSETLREAHPSAPNDLSYNVNNRPSSCFERF